MPDKKNRRYPGFQKRLNLVGTVVSIACAILVMRLWHLQVVQWGKFLQESESNRLRIQRLESPRGQIVGRLGTDDEVVLADNRAATDLVFFPAECDLDPALVAKRLENLIGADADALLTEIQSAIDERQPYRKIVIRRDVPHSVLARVEEYAYALPGVTVDVQPQRRYLFGKTAGQLMGYLNEINREELERSNDRYRMGDLIGRRGLEERYEDLLHGRDGQMLVTKFARGRPQIRTDVYGKPYIDELFDEFGHRLTVEPAIQQPISGKPLYVTLDIGLQQVCESLLEGEEGAIAVLNAKTGAVLALASAPSYDPNIFVTRGLSDQRRDVLTGKPNRMLNRCYQEVYAPGSTFKILLAAAGLEEGIIDANTRFTCYGKFRLQPGGRPWHCWKRSGHGAVDVVDSIAFSCDVFFYNVGQRLGAEKIKEWCDKVHLGQKTGIDLPGEVTGLIPSPAWKEALLKPQSPDEPWKYRWYPGETINLSIGQGSAATTPLQIAVLMAAAANGGYRVQPFLNREADPHLSERLWSEATQALIVEGMRKCVEKGPPAPSGTGHAAKIDGMTILGKTGSAQMVSLSHHEQYATEEDIPKEIRDHAWFIAGVVDRDPPIAICVLVEHGHHGSSAAAPLAKTLIEYYYKSLEEPTYNLAQGDAAQ